MAQIPIYEQETTVLFMRDEPTAILYSSDSTQITRLNKLCKESPEMWQCVEKGEYGNRYLCKDKTLISFRKKKVTRELSEEQKQVLSERMTRIRGRKSGSEECDDV